MRELSMVGAGPIEGIWAFSAGRLRAQWWQLSYAGEIAYPN